MWTRLFSCLTLLWLASIQNIRAFSVTGIESQVGLKGIAFDLVFTLEYNKSDEEASVDTVLATVNQENVQIGISNNSLFDKQGIRQHEFTVSNVIIDSTGKQSIRLDVLLVKSAQPPSASSEVVKTSKDDYIWVIPGGLTLVPLLVTMVIAVISRNVVPALFFGVLTAAFLTYEFDLPSAFARSLDSIILTSLTQTHNQLVILFAMIMGGFVSMINDSQGSIGLASALGNLANSGRSTQMVTLFFGLLIFFDDYASALILGATLRTIADKMSVSREKFCFLVDSGAAPIAALVPVTSWTAFESALLQTEADKLVEDGVPFKQLGYETSGFLGLLRMLKYAYYSIFLLMFQVILIVSKREFGPMFLAERRALLHGVNDEIYGFKRVVEDDEDEENEKAPAKCCNAGLPILFFIIYVVVAMVILGTAAVPVHEVVGMHNIFANVDSITVMYYAAVLASLFAIVLYRLQRFMPRRIVREQGGAVVSSRSWIGKILNCQRGKGSRPVMTINQSVESFVQGFAHLTSTIMILVLAWSIGSAVDYLGAGRFLATALQGNVPPASLPALIFVISCIVAFATGTSWGTMALLYPICGPVAFFLSEGNAELYYCSMAAILEGSVFGDHCSFISDTTIMSAMACKCPLSSHVVTQIPYAIFVAFTSLVCGYIPIGLQTLPVGVTYLVGFATTLVGILLLGANPEGERLDVFNWLYVQLHIKCLRTNPEDLRAIMLMKTPVGNHNDLANSRNKPLESIFASNGNVPLNENENFRRNNNRVEEEADGATPIQNPLRRRTFEEEDEAERQQRQLRERGSVENANGMTSSTTSQNPFEIDYEHPSFASVRSANNSPRHLATV